MKWKSSSSVNSIQNNISFRAAALITAAGSSSRMGSGIKKEFLPIAGKPMLLHTVEQFLETGYFFICCVTIRETEMGRVSEILRPCLEKNQVFLTPGGETRQQSVLNGLEGLLPRSPTHVLIHDGARPWVSGKTIEQVLAVTIENGAAAPVVPAVNALKIVNEAGVLKKHLSRESVFGVQTPQGFRFDEVLAAHREAADDGNLYIDDTEIYSRYCGEVYAVPGNPENRKITYNHDLGD